MKNERFVAERGVILVPFLLFTGCKLRAEIKIVVPAFILPACNYGQLIGYATNRLRGKQ